MASPVHSQSLHPFSPRRLFSPTQPEEEMQNEKVLKPNEGKGRFLVDLNGNMKASGLVFSFKQISRCTETLSDNK